MRALVSLCRLLLLLQIAVVAPSILASPARAAEPVDLLLVLAADVSSSVKEPEFRLQRTGYAKAFLEPRVISAIRATPTGRIAVIFVEWSGPLTQKVVVDWTLVDGEAAARRASQVNQACRVRLCSCSCEMNWALGSGPARKVPWPRSHPMSQMALRSTALSRPSATETTPK